MVPGFSESQRERKRNAVVSRVGELLAAMEVEVAVEEVAVEVEAVTLAHASSKNDKQATAASSRSLRT